MKTTNCARLVLSHRQTTSVIILGLAWLALVYVVYHVGTCPLHTCQCCERVEVALLKVIVQCMMEERE